MKEVRFVLAVPRQPPPDAPRRIEDAPTAGAVCGSSPRLWASEGVPQIENRRVGRVLGIVFARDTARPRIDLAGAPVHCGPEAIARWMVRACWGAYVAFLADPDTRSIGVLVDPSGLLPVYRAETETHALLASHPSLLEEAGKRSLQIDWMAVRAHLERSELRRRSTCLVGVAEVPPGSLVYIGGPERTEEQFWRPGDFLPGDTISFDDAAEELAALATSAIGAWSRRLGPVAVAASGGVDSSFICAALARAGHPFACATLRTSDPSGDESAFVRVLAEHLDASFHDAAYDLDQADPRHSASAGLPRPSRRSFLRAVDAGLTDAARKAGSAVVFDGNGGDNLFCFLHSAAPVVDHLLSRAPPSAVVATLTDMCRVTGCDLVTMMLAVLRRLLRRRPSSPWPADTRLLADTSDPRDEGEPLSPWLDAFGDQPCGKRDHLALIMRAQHQIHGLGAGGLPRFSPLMSQPLLEFCLSVPSWLWCQGGINRSLARSAFASDLPRSIMLRTSKAGPDSFIRQSFVVNRPAIRELLLGGLLAEHGLLDSREVEQALEVDALSGDSIVYRLLDLAEAESWARSWRS